MKKLVIFPALLFFLLAAGQPAWKQGLHYRLQAKLDTQLRAVDGKMDLRYSNHSPDTLHFIWFHIWPNAYRNDRTSYSEQLLKEGKTAFYFSDPKNRGYMNRLEFRISGVPADFLDHPEYQDVVRLMLPDGLAPGDSLLISASFHVQLPYNFSGSGYRSQIDQVTNWYPEPAVYDRKGWHPMPFLEEGGADREAADFEVGIQVPEGYTLAANSSPDSVTSNGPEAATHYQFSIKNANAFCWVAGKQLLQRKDSVLLDSGKKISVHLYYLPENANQMQKQLDSAGPLLRQLSRLLISYPYPDLNIVESPRAPEQSFSGILFLDRKELKSSSQDCLRKALLAQWFRAVSLSDERLDPWLSKGFIEYYNRILQVPATKTSSTKTALKDDRLWLRVAEKEGTAQPISTPFPALRPENNSLIAGAKAATWIQLLEDSIGKAGFRQGMRAYFHEWKFGHPYPEDLKDAFEKASGKNLEKIFERTHDNQPVIPASKRTLKAAFLFSAVNTRKYNYVSFAPAVGYNRYDRLMAGGMIHNFNLPENNFQFLFIPLYATGSSSLQGLGRVSYSWHPGKSFRKITVGLNGSRFSVNAAKDSAGAALFEGFSKLVPYLRFDFKNASPQSSVEKWMDFKFYAITEKSFSGYALSSKDTLIHPNAVSSGFRYLNQWSMNIRDSRALYPYDARLELQQSNLFYRVNLSARYFFNYPSGGGMRIRFFAAKFGVWNNNNTVDLSRYEPKLLGITGEEDYTYDQYFIGRSSSYAVENTSVPNDGWMAQQIMIRDGGLKLRMDAYDYVQGRSADWVSALNFSTTLPEKLFPIPVPLRIFFDIGSYAEAWKTNAETSRFLYTAGIQLSLFRNVLNIYAPLFCSSDFRDLIKTEGFGRRITFSIDIQNFRHINSSMIRHAFRQ